MNSGINPKENDYELAKANAVAMNCHCLVCSIMSVAYFVEFLKGDRTLLYVLVTIILAMAPVAGEFISYKKMHDTKMIKHFVGIGYAILYTFVMFTTNNHFTFVYVIPMLIAITVYNDFKYSLPIEVGWTRTIPSGQTRTRRCTAGCSCCFWRWCCWWSACRFCVRGITSPAGSCWFSPSFRSRRSSTPPPFRRSSSIRRGMSTRRCCWS